jgi:hypothetical protein
VPIFVLSYTENTHLFTCHVPLTLAATARASLFLSNTLETSFHIKKTLIHITAMNNVTHKYWPTVLQRREGNASVSRTDRPQPFYCPLENISRFSVTTTTVMVARESCRCLLVAQYTWQALVNNSPSFLWKSAQKLLTANYCHAQRQADDMGKLILPFLG